MSNSQSLQRVFNAVSERINQAPYRWVSTDAAPDDYFDLGYSHLTTADSIIAAMLADGVLVNTDIEATLTEIRQHPAYDGDVVSTANAIEQITGSTRYNYAVSQALRLGVIEEA